MKGRRGMGDFVVDDEDEEYTEPKHKKGKKAESEEEDMSDGSASDASDASETDSVRFSPTRRRPLTVLPQKKRVKKEKVAKTATKRTAPAPKPSSVRLCRHTCVAIFCSHRMTLTIRFMALSMLVVFLE